MPQSIFISYVYEDKKHRDTVERWFNEQLVGPNRVSIAESEDLRPRGDAAIRQHLEPKIRGAAAVLCLVGESTHNHRWVEYELDFADRLHKTIVLARVPGSRGSAPLRYRHLSVHTLDPSLIRKLLDA